MEGTGIGLAISKELMGKMNGRIGFESDEGVGSHFWIEFPATEALDIASVIGQAGAPSVRNLDVMIGELSVEKTIMYVEDNHANVALMKRIIGRAPNVNLITFGTAERALKYADSNPLDLILMDIDLPGMNGIEAKYVLAANPKTCDQPVVAISANVMEKDIEDAMAAGMVQYIKKHFNVVDTWKVILDVFNGSTA